MASATEAEMLDPALPGDRWYRLFHAEQARRFARRPFAARCRCSRDRIDRVLRSIRREELDDMRDKERSCFREVRVLSTEYAYDDSDLDPIYASAATRVGAATATRPRTFNRPAPRPRLSPAASSSATSAAVCERPAVRRVASGIAPRLPPPVAQPEDGRPGRWADNARCC